jgi:hypothetical protein
VHARTVRSGVLVAAAVIALAAVSAAQAPPVNTLRVDLFAAARHGRVSG